MKLLLLLIAFMGLTELFAQPSLELNDQNYFDMPGLNVTVFSDIYPDGHQTGVTIIQHGIRVAANGDVRLEISPGQWSPMPKGGKLNVDRENQILSQKLWYPDSSKNGTGFNPINYPDLHFEYDVEVEPLKNSSFRVSVNLKEPIPADWAGKMGFNLELFPGDLFGKSFIMDDQYGIFPVQPYGPIKKINNENLNLPLATGHELTIAPETDKQRMVISSDQEIELWDGRSNHNNGWYIVRTEIPANKTTKAIEWVITPHVIPNWQYTPVIQVSQVGYTPNQEKIAVIEMDVDDLQTSPIKLLKLGRNGQQEVKSVLPQKWGEFLRYQYKTFDFTDVKTPGMYVLEYRGKQSHAFKIGEDVYDRQVWQPTLEYFLPVQMCHMRVNEKYRVWHGRCHLDDALMAPIDSNHFDGYVQGPSTLTKFKPLEHVPQLNHGGWHDAGDYDLRVESQIGTVWMLALMIEEFGLDYDATLIDEERQLVEIHVPDGESDALQQIKHGLASILGGYRSIGRLYRGIICSDLRQYVMLGDAANMTDNTVYNQQGQPDDRLVFTEENPDRELYVAAGLAAAVRVLIKSDKQLADECLKTALSLYSLAKEKAKGVNARVLALSEIILTTGDQNFKDELIKMAPDVASNMKGCGWAIGHVIHAIDNKKFKNTMAKAVSDFQQELKKQKTETPFGVPYKPNIWGAGWGLQRFGVEQYFFHTGWPELAPADLTINALNFVLGVHPGENTSSFASGVGSKSVTVAYGVNRAEWSYIPGGVASGTALIRPDLPELKVWPFFWQQTEYVMGGGATNYMFLVLAANHLLKK
ncbi:glycoside hydrolase family 9 protein [Fulvivirga sediminis]|uniref:Glycoside hydrolase family 9 protein n=1 Tax=Fulvivirga sediminis TaxID=2803949 RepID=A0A937FBK3_9BACT|nr:glycoside hydrolase family 9 protein [Fulvivirga sediminis]MBL3658169.1 glycoside hydrolase family 9 protein [Fulvivirga sediminis]